MIAVCATAVTALAIALSYDARCAAPPSLSATSLTIKAYRYHCYGSPEVLALTTVARPVPADSEVLVKVQAASVNPLDWHFMRGKPYVMRLSSGIGAPKDQRIGADFAGTVEAVGSTVTQFKVGGRVFGVADGTFAEYVTVGERRAIALMPDSATFEQASAVGIAATTALQAVRDKGQVKSGHHVLVNGASGGVGTFVVQIAKSYGAHVTGVASTRNVALVTALGADSVIDYTTDNFTTGSQRYDVIIDMVGNHDLRAVEHVLARTGNAVIVGGPNANRWLGPLTRTLGAILRSPFVRPTFTTLLASANQSDLGVLRDMMQGGKLKSVIDRRFPFQELPAAVEYLETGRARGKVIVSVATGAGFGRLSSRPGGTTERP